MSWPWLRGNVAVSPPSHEASNSSPVENTLPT
jgi:hypothetical protein